MADIIPLNSTNNYNQAVSDATRMRSMGYSISKASGLFVKKFPPLGYYPQSVLLLMLKAGYTKMDAATAIKLWVGPGNYKKARALLQKTGLDKAQIAEIMTLMGGDFAVHAFEEIAGIGMQLGSAIMAGDLAAIQGSISAVPGWIVEQAKKVWTEIKDAPVIGDIISEAESWG